MSNKPPRQIASKPKPSPQTPFSMRIITLD